MEGTLEFGDFEDEYGYTYSYRIKDATYTTVSVEDLSNEQRLWQQLASTGVVSEVFNGMYYYVNFICNWGTYTAKFSGGEDYIYPSDVLDFLETEGASFNYGYKDDYFSGLIATIESVDKTAFADLVKYIREAEELTHDALEELRAGRVEETVEYSNYFGDGRPQFRLVEHETFGERMDDIFYGIAAWNSEWTLS